jgi:hypothetical protein
MSAFGRLDEMIGILIESWNHQYTFEIDRDRRFARFSRGGMQASAAEVADGLIHVTYESAPHEMVEEFCTVADAAALVQAVMARETLSRVQR